MPRLSRFSFLSAISVLALFGCGGTKTDFSIKPGSYTLTTASPAAAASVVLVGVSRDGRLVGTYLNAGKTTVFGWSADGPTVDLTLPTECKTVDGIDELGTVACSDRTATPNKLFLWHGNGTSQLTIPKGTTLGAVSSMSFEAGVATNVSSATITKQGFQLKEDQNPVAVSDAGGMVAGTSLNGNIAGTDLQGTLLHAVAMINGNKINLGLFGGQETVGNSVNDLGTVVGAIRVGGSTDSAFKWSKGAYTKLPNVIGAITSEAFDVNNEGVISGQALVGTVEEACVWFPQTGPVLVKDLVKLSSGVRLDNAVLTTPLGIVVCTGTVTDTSGTRAAVFALFPTFP